MWACLLVPCLIPSCVGRPRCIFNLGFVFLDNTRTDTTNPPEQRLTYFPCTTKTAHSVDIDPFRRVMETLSTAGPAEREDRWQNVVDLERAASNPKFSGAAGEGALVSYLIEVRHLFYYCFYGARGRMPAPPPSHPLRAYVEMVRGWRLPPPVECYVVNPAVSSPEICYLPRVLLQRSHTFGVQVRGWSPVVASKSTNLSVACPGSSNSHNKN